jgi:ribosomal protein S18 acetylase RimI-like enzyme
MARAEDWSGEDDTGLVVRTLADADLDRIVRIDQQYSGRNRRTWFEGKLKRALKDSDVTISLGAERDGLLVGVLMGSVHYGEFGLPEPVAILDTILVDRSFARGGIASAMMEQLVKNLAALRIETLRTEVSWDEQLLLSFLAQAGFRPAHRLVLERKVALVG